MITDIFNINAIKLLTLFSISPGSKFTRKEIKEKTVLNNVLLDDAAASLIKNKILIKEKRLLSLNFENKNLKNLLEMVKKEHIRFKEIPLKIYFILLDISSFFAGIKNISNIYLYGSYAKLIYTDKSDIDLAVVLENAGINDAKKFKKKVRKIEKKYNKEIHIEFFDKKDMEQKDSLVREISRNSVSLFEKK